MKTYDSGKPAPYGIYAASLFDICYVGADGEVLDGREGTRYVRLPTILMIALTPVLGGVFVLAFPFLVIAAVGVAVLHVAQRWLDSIVHEYSHLLKLRWEPVAAYLDPNSKGEKKETATTDPELEELQEEVDRRRADEQTDEGAE